MSLQTWNVLLPLVFLLYQIVIDFIDLYPFNDIHSRDKRLRKVEVLGNYPPLLVIVLCFFLDFSFSHWLGFIVTAIIFIMHLFAWWIPYVCGVPRKVREDYNRYFSRTYKFLPKIKDHIVPDAEHFIVGLLLVITLIMQLRLLFQSS